MKIRYAIMSALVPSVLFLSSLTPVSVLAGPAPRMPRISSLEILKAADSLPTDWIGVWSIHSVQKDCTTQIVSYDATVLDTLCTDSSIEPDSNSVFQTNCTTTINGNSYEVVCDGTLAVTDSCQTIYHQETSGTVTGSSFTVSGTITFSYSGSCFGLPDQCLSFTSTGTRVDSNPAVCSQTPVEPTSWGLLKSRYM